MANYQPEVLAVFEQSLKELRASGVEIVEITDFKIPEELAGAAGNTIINEFKSELNAYLASTPTTIKTRSLADLIAFNKAHAKEELSLFGQEYLEIAEAQTGVKDNPAYLESRKLAKRMAGAEGIDRLLAVYKLDALIAPTTNPAGKINFRKSQSGSEASVSTIAAIAGYPHLSVPMRFVNDLPVGLSFIGTAWSDAELLAFGYAFEQRTKARRPPNFIRSNEEKKGQFNRF
jgi:amidase